MSDEERKRLDKLGGELIRQAGIDTEIEYEQNEFEILKELGYVGFAHYYLQHSWDKSELVNKADISIYKQLIDIDSQLGTTASEQLFECVLKTLRMDLIKVF